MQIKFASLAFAPKNAEGEVDKTFVELTIRLFAVNVGDGCWSFGVDDPDLNDPRLENQSGEYPDQGCGGLHVGPDGVATNNGEPWYLLSETDFAGMPAKLQAAIAKAMTAALQGK